MRAFISFSNVDVEVMREIKELVQNEQVDTWDFISDTLPSELWEANYKQAVIENVGFICILSRSYLKSYHCMSELDLALQYQSEKVVIPIKIDNCEIPETLSHIQCCNWEATSIRTRSQETQKLIKALQSLRNRIQIPNRHKVERSSVPLDNNLLRAKQLLSPLFDWCFVQHGQVTVRYASDDAITYSISEDYVISKYPITNQQYQVFLDAADGFRNTRYWEFSDEARQWRQQHSVSSSIEYEGDNLPRTNITWYEAVAFCRWLSNRSGHEVTLPSEVYWLRAAQGDDERQFPWGNKFYFELCNIRSEKPVVVNAIPEGESPFGVVDMASNGCEWCSNKWVKRGNDDSLDGSINRVLKGYPHYGDEWEKVKLINRIHYPPDFVNNGTTFRIMAKLSNS